ncbi:MAG: radical SAM family heme chaperone HemW [Bifidobacteriaceae bacterium]|jgi:oxygen-independent coproporphyrinogen-3 oxidase|nr:radical SAM family heme chaperone HemW [Bifidobacteriaceae bacterium]
MAEAPPRSAVGSSPAEVPFQVYIHVPFCSRRCGYCDFNTYVAPAGERAAFADQAIAEMWLAAAALAQPSPGITVYFGGGTPTLLPAADLVRLLDAVRQVFGLVDGAEVTAEANPDTVDAAYLRRLADGGFTRLSLGMQSAVPGVLRTLDRTHNPARVAAAVEDARAAGLDVSADLIYGAPGESPADWEASVRAALDLGLGHISAYALTLEAGTPMARRIRAGALAEVDPDGQAQKYEIADGLFEAAGLKWYEISNWAKPGLESRHNLGYWTGADWLGIGPGAHSAVGPERFWNVKSPRRYAEALARGDLPRAGREIPDAAALALERVMLEIRTARGLACDALSAQALEASSAVVADGLATREGDRLVLTRRGRLLADLVTRRLTFF